MPLTFNQALGAYGFDPAQVRLLRHQGRGPAGQTPFTLWRDQRLLFEAYQATQQVKDRARLDGAIWASFVVTPEGRTLFAGLYAVQAKRAMEPDWPYPLGPRSEEGVDELYDLDRVELFSEFEGRLYIDWGLATRTWMQRADRQDKPVVELAAAFAEPAFPGFSTFVEPLSRIMSLPPTWASALSAVRGVYVLVCPRTREFYVGSATGAGGFLGRWRDYALTGHGGDVRLMSREPSDYQVAILEVGGSLDSDGDILALETRWKQKLQSRALGLNGN